MVCGQVTAVGVVVLVEIGVVMSKGHALFLVGLVTVGIAAAATLLQSNRTSTQLGEAPIDSPFLPADASGDTPG